MSTDGNMKQLRSLAKHITKGLRKADRISKTDLPYGLVPMRAIIPSGKSGNCRIEHYEVTEAGAAMHNLRHAINNTPEMCIEPGTHVRLIVGNDLMMSDTPFEARSNRDIIEGARGNVLIAGLGMGMVLVPILRNPDVHSVTVVEKSNDVINLVYKHLIENGPFTPNEKMKLVLVPGDIFDYRPKASSYDVVYFDIWPTISQKNLDDAIILRKQFKKSLKPGGWMGVWVEKEILKRKREDDRFIAAAKARRDARKRKVS
jgi:hypothetical protein